MSFTKDSVERLKLAGDIAHSLNMPIDEALKLDNERLRILSNEANRQRMLDVIYISKLFSKSGDSSISQTLKIHGPYTDGFYSAERDSLTAYLTKRKSEK